MSITGGLPRAIERANAAGCECLQIFTKSSGQWRARPLPPAEISAFREGMDVTDVRPGFAHASYLINLASPDDTLRDRSMAALGEEMDRAEALGLAGVVLHPGSFTPATPEQGLRRIADATVSVLRPRATFDTRLLLEHTAGQGTNLGHTFEQLEVIIKEAEGAGAPVLGLCLDTCHLVAAGYELSEQAGYDDTLGELDTRIGLERVSLWHLNDSKTPRGSRVDRHTHIGAGHVGLDGFRHVLPAPRFADHPMVLETPKAGNRRAGGVEADEMDLENLRTLRQLLADR